jgi:hypothetical protein
MKLKELAKYKLINGQWVDCFEYYSNGIYYEVENGSLNIDDACGNSINISLAELADFIESLKELQKKHPA